MSEQYSRELLRVAVAQICQTIGYNSTQTSSLELLQDLLHRFLNEFARDLRRQVEHDNRTTACLEDVTLTFSSVNINMNELLDYIGNVEPVPFAIDVPNFPVKKHSNLNFLKPGSKEVLSRPVHIFEHLPPMLPPDTPQPYISGSESNVKSLVSYGIAADSGTPVEDKLATKIKTDADERSKLDVSIPSSSTIVPTALTSKSLPLMDEHGRPTREIMSVVMTTGGFISPAIEGKLPEAGIPALVDKFFGLDAPPPPTPPLPSEPMSAPAASNKVEKLLLESSAKQIAGKEIFSNVAKKNTVPLELIEKVKQCDEVGYLEETASLKKNISTSSVKKNPSQQSSQTLQPTVALKLLKKAKKKNTGLNEHPSEIAVSDTNTEKLSDKANRKRLKMLQKMLKNTQKQQFVGGGGVDVKKEGKKNKSLPNMNLFSEISQGIGQLRFEKLLKKQAKQKQKLQKIISFERQQLAEKYSAQSHAVDGNDISTVELPPAQLEGTYPKLLQKHEIKQESLSLNNTAITPPLLANSFDKSAHNIISVQTQPGNVPTGTQNTLPSPEKNTGLQLKLSNEPDRSKLNIFKKISKGQKGPGNQPAPIPKPGIPSNSFTGSEGQIINLPTGTTITPAPLSFHSPTKLNLPTECSRADSIGNATLDLSTKGQTEAINKPKKRGRKPGSKNQPKVLPSNDALSNPEALQPILLKKQKKLKMNAPVADTSVPQPTATSLNYPKIEPYQKNPLPIFSAPLLKPPRKERKEKQKNVDIFPNLSDMSQLKDPNKPIQAPIMPFAGIPMTSLNMLFNNSNEQNITAQPKPRKRPPNQIKNSSQPANMLPAFLTATQTATGFGQLPSTNMLSMLPFAFPPRPGLIPTPGFFPTTPGLPNFSSQMSNPSSSNTGNGPGLLGLPPAFLNFPTASTNKAKERTVQTPEPTAISTTYPVDRNYCNVAPLIPPESIKQVSETAGNNPLMTMGKQYPLKVTQPESKLNVSAENINEIFNSNATQSFPVKQQESAHNLSRKAPVTMPPLANVPSSTSNVTSNLEKHTPTGGVDDPIEVSDDSDETTMLPTNTITTRNPFDAVPMQVPKTPKLPSPTLPLPSNAFTNESLQEGSQRISGSHEPDIKSLTKDGKKVKKNPKHPKKNPKILESGSAGLDILTANCSSGDGFSKLAGGADLIPLSGTGSAYSARSIPSTSLTGSRSLSIESVAYEHGKKENASESENRFNDVTITPNIQKKKNKAHKKLRKLKDGDGGKVKKKKDKKDKSKDKELLEFALGQKTLYEKLGDKEALRRLKKERKKQKQRSHLSTANELSPTEANLQNPQLPSTFGKLTDSADTSAINTPPTISGTSFATASAIGDSTIPSQVPKLTLKLGNSQSPVPLTVKIDEDIQNKAAKRDPSPELARFSPLVTRPPKQKISQSDNSKPISTMPNTECKSNLSVKPTDSLLNSTTQSVIPPPSPWLPGGTLTASSVLLPQQLMPSTAAKPKADQHALTPPTSKVDNSLNTQRSATSAITSIQNPLPMIAETNRPSSYVDAEGNTVWICPACGKVDDGSPMIGCDGCDAWYHWECVGIAVAPNDKEDWFCRVCITRKKGFHSTGDGSEKKRKRNKKK